MEILKNNMPMINIADTLKGLSYQELEIVERFASLIKSKDLVPEYAIKKLEFITWDYTSLMLSDINRDRDDMDGFRLRLLFLLKGVFMNKTLPDPIDD